MMMSKTSERWVVSSRPGEGTAETIYEDNGGRSYRVISEAQARDIENTTAGRVYRIYPNGSIQ